MNLDEGLDLEQEKRKRRKKIKVEQQGLETIVRTFEIIRVS